MRIHYPKVSFGSQVPRLSWIIVEVGGGNHAVYCRSCVLEAEAEAEVEVEAEAATEDDDLYLDISFHFFPFLSFSFCRKFVAGRKASYRLL